MQRKGALYSYKCYCSSWFIQAAIKNTANLVAYRQQKGVPYSSGGWKPEIWVLVWLCEGSPLGHRLLTSGWFLIWQKGGKKLSGASFLRAPIPFVRLLPL